MQTKRFRSKTSNDYIIINHPKNYNDDDVGINIIIKVYNIFDENLRLVDSVINYANNRNIQWISVIINGKYITPQNAVLYKSSNKKQIRCHITDFEEFYKHNMNKIITPQHIHAKKSKKKDKDGWVISTNVNEVRKQKYEELNKKIQDMLKETNDINNIVNDVKKADDEDDWTKM